MCRPISSAWRAGRGPVQRLSPGHRRRTPDGPGTGAEFDHIRDQPPRKFIFEGSDLVRVWPGDRVDDALIDTVRGRYFGLRRTLTQDVEFAIDQLVEVAVRALSPGVNDPFTAINCVDRLGAALCVLAAKEIPSPFRYDESNRLRVITDRSTASGMIDASFNQIRQAARGDAAVTLRLLESIVAIDQECPQPGLPRGPAAARRLDPPWQPGRIAGDIGREDADDRYRQALRALDAEGPSRAIGGQA